MILFHYDQQGRLLSETTGSGSAIRDYVYQNDNLVALKLYGEQAGIYYVITDHLGTPQQMVNSAGVVVWKAAYLPFGDTQIDVETITNNIRFKGQYHDIETGLHYNWHRFYDPSTGRYISADPIGLFGGLNLYSYANQNPINYIDPWGLQVQVHSRDVGGTLGSGAHTFVTVKDKYGITRTYGSYEVGGKNKVIVNNESDQGPNSLSRTSSITIAPPPGMSQEQWDNAVNQSGQSRNLTQNQDYELWGGDGGDSSGNCHTTTRGIINDAGGQIPSNYDPPGLNPGLHP